MDPNIEIEYEKAVDEAVKAFLSETNNSKMKTFEKAFGKVLDVALMKDGGFNTVKIHREIEEKARKIFI